MYCAVGVGVPVGGAVDIPVGVPVGGATVVVAGVDHCLIKLSICRLASYSVYGSARCIDSNSEDFEWTVINTNVKIKINKRRD